MGIEDHIRDIIRQKVNERVGQEVGVLKRDLGFFVMKEVKRALKTVEEPDVSNIGAFWTDEEDERLDEEMGMCLSWMASIHSRNTGGIRARLRKHAEDTDCRPLI